MCVGGGGCNGSGREKETEGKRGGQKDYNMRDWLVFLEKIPEVFFSVHEKEIASDMWMWK